MKQNEVEIVEKAKSSPKSGMIFRLVNSQRLSEARVILDFAGEMAEQILGGKGESVRRGLGPSRLSTNGPTMTGPEDSTIGLVPPSTAAPATLRVEPALAPACAFSSANLLAPV